MMDREEQLLREFEKLFRIKNECSCFNFLGMRPLGYDGQADRLPENHR